MAVSVITEPLNLPRRFTAPGAARRPKVLFLVTEDWYFCSHRLPVARAARDMGADVVVATRAASCAERIRAEGSTLVPLGRLRRRSFHPWAELGALVEIVAVYRRERPDL